MARLVKERSDVLPIITEVFRQHGYEGASLSLIGEATGLGKGSLYNFFPAGKKAMADAVLEDIGDWFQTHVFSPLEDTKQPKAGIETMFTAVESYFHSGQRMCLAGIFALDETRNSFSYKIQAYFSTWITLLEQSLKALGHKEAQVFSEEIVGGIQGALVLSRALDDNRVFMATLNRYRSVISKI